MRVNIWIPDVLADEMKATAKAQEKSLSAYLYGLHKSVFSTPEKISHSNTKRTVRKSSDFHPYDKDRQLGNK